MDDRDKAALRRLMVRCHETAKAKGWCREEEEVTAVANWIFDVQEKLPDYVISFLRKAVWLNTHANGVDIPQKLMLIVTEAAEAMEAFRDKNMHPQRTYRQGLDGKMTDWGPDTDPATTKPEGVGSELADVFIRVLHLANAAGIDLVTEIDRKMTFNEGRPDRHGGKRA